MNSISFDPQHLPSLVGQASSILESHGFLITPNVIQKLRGKLPILNQEDLTKVIDLAMTGHRVLKHSWYSQIAPWLFTEQTLMQSSEPDFAEYVISKLKIEGESLIEVCTGSGMHLYSALKNGASRIVTHETDAFIGILAGLNAHSHGYHIQPIMHDGAKAEVTTSDVFWADPSRRLHGTHRSSPTGYYSPDITVLLEKAVKSRRGGIKIAPGERIEGAFSREFLGSGKECKEQILWIHTDTVDGSVRLIDKQKSFIPQDIDTLPELCDIDSITKNRYLLEPHPALIRGALSAMYAEKNIAVFDRSIAYGLTNDKQDRDWFSHFEIIHCERFSRGRLQEFLDAHDWNGLTEIKKRGFPMEPDEVRKQLRFSKGETSGVIILTRCKDEHIMILGKRI